MEKKLMVEKFNEIEMPKEMQERIIRNCYKKMEEHTMSENTTKIFGKKPMVAVASLVLCICLSGVTVLAATESLRGFFKDITGWNGAVTGNTYEQATDEMELNVAVAADNLSVEITMLKSKETPYSSFESLCIESYKIMDMDGNVIVEDKATEPAEVVAGKVNVKISLDNIPRGKYRLIVSKLVGAAKAEQPLVINGTWECEFVK